MILNRSFLYGDGFFESMLISNGHCHLLALHVDRIKESAKILKMNFPETWTLSYWEDIIKQYHHKFPFELLRMKIIFYRKGLGKYMPDDNDMAYEIICNQHVDNENKSFLTAKIYHEQKKPISILSNLKTNSALLFVMAGIWANEQKLDAVIILNEHNRVCEGLYSNIFIKKNNTYYTPSLQEGCVNGVYRKMFIKAHQNQIIEQGISIEDLQDADLIFFTNAVMGIQHVKLQ